MERIQKRVRLREKSKGANTAFDEIRKKTTITFGGFTVTLPQRRETTEIDAFMTKNEIRSKFDMDDRSKNILKMGSAEEPEEDIEEFEPKHLVAKRK